MLVKLNEPETGVLVRSEVQLVKLRLVEDCTLTNFYHGYPAIRNAQEKYLIAVDAKL